MSRWQATRLVMRRELGERIREKSFLVSTGISVLIIGVVALLPSFLGDGPDELTVGAVGAEQQVLAHALEDSTTGSDDLRIEARDVGDEAEARREVEAGNIDAALIGESRVVVDEELTPDFRALLQTTLQQDRILEAFADAGVDQERAQQAISPARIEVEELNPPSPHRDDRRTVAAVGAFLLFGQIFGYGFWVSMGVVEEKSSRVVEVLLSKIRPSQLLAGKVIGIGILGLVQLAAIAAFGIAIALITNVIELPPGTIGTVGLVFLYFIIGYAFYSCSFAVAGAIVSRQEELQSTTAPMSLMLYASFFLAFFALSNPDSVMAQVASYVPMSAPLTMPQRVAYGSATGVEAALSIALSIAVTVLLIPLASRLYSGAILRMGSQVKLKEAWRSAA
jgi:ABC-2 type transport system permease protein